MSIRVLIHWWSTGRLVIIIDIASCNTANLSRFIFMMHLLFLWRWINNANLTVSAIESTTNNDVEHIVKMTLMTMPGESFIGGKSTFLVFHATYSPYEKTADFHTNKKDSQTSTLSQVHSWIYMNNFSFDVLCRSEFWNYNSDYETSVKQSYICFP
jgi:hypothetical protein